MPGTSPQLTRGVKSCSVDDPPGQTLGSPRTAADVITPIGDLAMGASKGGIRSGRPCAPEQQRRLAIALPDSHRQPGRSRGPERSPPRSCRGPREWVTEKPLAAVGVGNESRPDRRGEG